MIYLFKHTRQKWMSDVNWIFYIIKIYKYT